MLLSRQTKKKTPTSPEKQRIANSDFHTFVDKTDYTGALAILSSKKRNGNADLKTLLWIAYCKSHLDQNDKAIKDYKEILEICKKSSSSSSLNLLEGYNKKETIGYVLTLLAVSYFINGEYLQSKKYAERAQEFCSPIHKKLAIRVLFHVSHKLDDEQTLFEYHSELEDTLENQLSLASIHFMRTHYQEAVDLYKKLLTDNRHFLALNFYIALCYYKMDHHDISQEVLSIYLEEFPDSTIARNLKACNMYKLYNTKVAQKELQMINAEASANYKFCKEIIDHNLVVFKNGEGAQQILPPLVNTVPEALINLAIYYLKQDDIDEAFRLIKDIEPSTPAEYTIAGTVYAMYGQKTNNREYMNKAHTLFQTIGCSSTECDTVPGRQAMASCFFLLKQFEDVLLYLASIKMYYSDDDIFNYNYGQAKAAVGKWSDAEDALLRIKNDDIKQEHTFLATLIRSCIKNKNARKAFNIYLKIDPNHQSSNQLLHLIANDCYKSGQFFYAAKTFDIINRMDPTAENWQAKLGACIGYFQQVVAGEGNQENLMEVMRLLSESSNSQAEYALGVISEWLQEQGMAGLDEPINEENY